MKCEDAKVLSAGYLDDELDDTLREEFEKHCAICSSCAAELARGRKIRDELLNYKLPDMPDKYWKLYWASIYNKIERRAGALLLTIGTVIVCLFLAKVLIAQFFADPSQPLILKIGILALIAGTIVLVISIIRERMFAKKHERYEGVEL